MALSDITLKQRVGIHLLSRIAATQQSSVFYGQQPYLSLAVALQEGMQQELDHCLIFPYDTTNTCIVLISTERKVLAQPQWTRYTQPIMTGKVVIVIAGFLVVASYRIARFGVYKYDELRTTYQSTATELASTSNV